MYYRRVYRIYPNKEQKNIIARHFGSCRFIYNKLLEVKQFLYNRFKMDLSESDLNDYILLLKEAHPWLCKTNAWSLQQANHNLQRAYRNFFDRRTKYPKRKTKKNSKQTYWVSDYSINLSSSEIRIPQVGWIKVKLHRALFDSQFFEQNIIVSKTESDLIIRKYKNTKFLKTITILKTPTDKYYVSILTNDQKDTPQKQHYNESNTIGVDVGLKSFAVTSNEEVIENPKYLEKSQKKLQHLQRCANRKKKGSKNRKKANSKVAKCHEKIANQRRDFQHKLSTRLVCENQAIAIETLNIKGLLKNHCLARAISDSAWYSFTEKLAYKAEWIGTTILKIGRFEPSSKTCHVCGYHKKDLTLISREWNCPNCNTHHDRDINAAKNIKNFALNSAMEQGTELVELSKIAEKQETFKHMV